ncbi:MAG: alpha/beta fold hydrolase, partial [Gammaproteobacteria bacterium]
MVNATWLDTLIPPWQRRRALRGPGASSRADIRYVHLPEASIRYRIAGDGARTVVLCADPPVVLELYDELIARLAAEYRVVVFEPPAFGLSLPRAGLDFSMEATARVIGAFLDALGTAPYVLAFPCVPAYCALWLAAQRPQLVEALVLMQAPSWHEELKWKRGRDPKNVLGRPWLGQILLRLLRRKRASAWYRLALGRRELLPTFAAETERAFEHGACFSLASAFQRFLTATEPGFAAVHQPALVIWGGADRSHAQTDRESIRRHLPQARIVHIDDAGHFPELEAPQRFAAELRG